MAHLMYEDRERIAELLDMGKNLSAIAQDLGCYPSTISREIERGAVFDKLTGERLMKNKRRPVYDPLTAQKNYDTRRNAGREQHTSAGSVTYYPTRKISPWHASVVVTATNEKYERFFPTESTAWAYIEEINETKNGVIYEARK